MASSSTFLNRKFKQNLDVLVLNSMLTQFPFEDGMNITDSLFIKEEIKEELIEDEIVKIDSILFNTDISFGIEESNPVYTFRCHQCNYNINDKKTLTDHIFTHRLKCNECGYSTYDNDSLISHKQIHFTIGFLRCKFCNYTCIDNRTLDEHQSTHFAGNKKRRGQVSEKSFECKLCDLITEHSYSLKINSEHFDEQHFRCDKCSYKTNVKSRFGSHIKMHFEEKTYKCNLCQYKTYTKPSLIMHRRRHSDKKLLKRNIYDIKSSLGANKRKRSQAKAFK
ncbi:hypothetical protein FQR65_LT14239 [Abscondita terminalis]|nr:hypothetical protein FQR65_LT14239 [Abscondita terminalis]